MHKRRKKDINKRYKLYFMRFYCMTLDKARIINFHFPILGSFLGLICVGEKLCIKYKIKIFVRATNHINAFLFYDI